MTSLPAHPGWKGFCSLRILFTHVVGNTTIPTCAQFPVSSSSPLDPQLTYGEQLVTVRVCMRPTLVTVPGWRYTRCGCRLPAQGRPSAGAVHGLRLEPRAYSGAK
jgi:hypothetical protein